MCRSSRSCSCDGMGPIERKIKEGLPNLQPSPTLTPEPAFKVPPAEEREESSLLREVMQSQLALWTLSLSSLFTWLWTSRKRCLVFNVCLLLPASLALTALLSGALLVFVWVGRLLVPAATSPVPSWVVRRLPEPSCPSLLRRRRSLVALQQHSLRNRRYRALASASDAPAPTLLPSATAPSALSHSSSNPKLHSYFWQRSHSPPPAISQRLSASHFRG